MSSIYAKISEFNKSPKDDDKRIKSFKDQSLIISDLDEFFKNIYDYYYNRGYKNIRLQYVLDNISYLFAAHFIIANIYIINWNSIIAKCVRENDCSLEITEYLKEDFSYSNFSFAILYSLFIIYYISYLYKSTLHLLKMNRIKFIFEQKFHIKQKEMENMKFDEIMLRVIELQRIENFSRVKENLTKFDIISRIMRRENYMIALLSNNVLNFHVRIPFTKSNLNFFSSYIYNNIMDCILNFAFLPGEVDLNQKIFNIRLFTIRMITYMIYEIVFLPSRIFFKIIFSIFKNADNIKSNRNLINKTWKSHQLILFKNYNELHHHFEHRINKSYHLTEKFINCFKDRRFSIFAKFLSLIGGSFLLLIFIISAIDNRLLTELKIFGKNIVWVTFVLGIILSIAHSNSQNSRSHAEEDYIENMELKEKLQRHLINELINIPNEWRISQNNSKVYKKIDVNYTDTLKVMFKELLTILIFPLLWWKVISQAKSLSIFFKLNSTKIQGVGTICSYSFFDMNHFKCVKEKESIFTEISFNDRKFIASFLFYGVSFIIYLIDEFFIISM
jgi:autophagy-related protein 9